MRGVCGSSSRRASWRFLYNDILERLRVEVLGPGLRDGHQSGIFGQQRIKGLAREFEDFGLFQGDNRGSAGVAGEKGPLPKELAFLECGQAHFRSRGLMLYDLHRSTLNQE